VTAASLAIASLSLCGALRQRPVQAAWLGLLCTLTDRLDGLLARALDARSEFGVQFDSLADLVAFGVVPGAIYYSFYSAHPELGWTSSGAAIALPMLVIMYIIAAAARLARFNVLSTTGPARDYLGVPSTMTAGMVLALFLVGAKYGLPALGDGAVEHVDSWEIFRWRSRTLLQLMPLALPVGALAMLSPLRVPRLGKTAHRVTDVVLFGMVGAGAVLGVARHLPEYLALGGVLYLAIAARYHLRRRA
jgi:CDP-diacylglycerol--serine O-phosphatidyltransferase